VLGPPAGEAIGLELLLDRAIGLDAGALVSDEVLGGMRDSAVTRLFIDPAVDPDSGDVHGKILRLAPLT